MPTIKDRIAKLITGFVPTRKITVLRGGAETPALAHTLDAGRVYDIFRAAENLDPTQLFALYRDILLADAHIQAEFNKRLLAVLGDPLSIQAASKDPADVRAQEIIQQAVDNCDYWFELCKHLLHSSLWPVAVVEKVFRPSDQKGLRYEWAEFVPVDWQLLDFQTGHLRIRDTDEEGNILGSSHEVDYERYIIHRGHLLSTPDWWGGPFRSLVWWWLLSTMSRDWWSRFLERYGSPFLVGRYPEGDTASRSVLASAFAYAVKIGGLVVSKETEVEVKQAATSTSADAYNLFLTICQREKSKLIVGQTLSAEAQPTGLGSAVAKTQEAVRQDIRQFDAMMLARTLKTEVFEQFLRVNGIPGRTPRPVWGAETYENAELFWASSGQHQPGRFGAD